MAIIGGVTTLALIIAATATTTAASARRARRRPATTVAAAATTPNAARIPATLPTDYTLPKSAGSINLTALPLGDNKVSLTTAVKGGIWACRIDANAGGSRVVGPWINPAANTFDYTAKYIVDGDVSWPSSFATTVEGDRRVFTSNDLPKHTTGIFPIAASDDAYQVDRNPSAIVAQTLSFSVPVRATVNPKPTCTPGEVGITLDGVMILNALDAPGRDAVAHEAQDHCDGHPNPGGYHYHNLSRCITENADGSGRLVGWILDGFPLMSRMEDGKLVTDADLDECHGHTGTITIDGKHVTTYHYHATYEFPYTVGCMRGTPTRLTPGAPPAGGPSPGPAPGTPPKP